MSFQTVGWIVPKVLSLERHKEILQAGFNEVWSFGEWYLNPMPLLIVLILLNSFNSRKRLSTGFITVTITLIAVFIGYYCVYLTTPWTLADHLNSSLNRLYLQFWPTFLLIVFASSSSGRTTGIRISP
jgi:hypothetical protein